MTKRTLAETLPAALTLLVKNAGLYTPRRLWGAFDALGLRAVDDLFFANGVDSKTIYAFTAEPPHGAGVESIAIPTQIFLDRFYFHVAQPTVLVLNEGSISADAAVPQQGVEFSLPEGFGERRAILRAEVPELVGALAADARALTEPLESAERALTRGSLFESFFLAREARRRGVEGAARIWFCELFSYSFFGAPEDALALYDECSERGGPEPRMQLLSARYRLLLKQFNEARTILHTLSFNDEVGALALCELARSFVVEKEFSRAIDLATAAIERDRDYVESYLVRGIAQRGISYDAGDAEGLREAFKDFERVAKRGGFSAAEASYHAGTVCARLGALSQAELAFRQSLFQRDRLSPRDALVRVLCAQERYDEAREELALLSQVAPAYGEGLRSQVGKALEEGGARVATPSAARRSGECGELWGESLEESLAAARAVLAAWGLPITGGLSDAAMFDECVNCFAPDGDFSREGRCGSLGVVGSATVARAMALHLAGLLVDRGVVSWGAAVSDQVSLISRREERRIPLESFVHERILLGASGDNFSSLESIVIEFGLTCDGQNEPNPFGWWEVADVSTRDSFQSEARWAKGILISLGAELTGTLADLDEIDRLMDASFEPGGGIREGVQALAAGDLDRFVAGVGLLVGIIVSQYARVEWYQHSKAEGISLYNVDLGRIFPVAKVQRRAYLASAADFGSKLGSLAWAVAAASVTEGIRDGRYVGAEQVREALLSRLPRVEQFPDTELQGVVDSLLIGASLK